MLKCLVLVTATIAILAAVPASALDFDQKAWYGQGVIALPMGDFGDLASFGFGAGLGILVPHSASVSFRAEASYIYYSTKDVPNGDYSFSMIPIQALAQYNMDSSAAYLLGGLGLTIGKSSSESTVPGNEFSVSSSDTEIGLVVGAGTNLSPTMTIEGRFNAVSDANYVSAHLGWWF